VSRIHFKSQLLALNVSMTVAKVTNDVMSLNYVFSRLINRRFFQAHLSTSTLFLMGDKIDTMDTDL
jgi:hypothetical protein